MKQQCGIVPQDVRDSAKKNNNVSIVGLKLNLEIITKETIQVPKRRYHQQRSLPYVLPFLYNFL